MGAYTTMTSKGQLTIPKDVRERLNLKTGTKFYVSEHEGRVVAIPKNIRAADLAGIFSSQNHTPVSQEEIDEAIKDHVVEDDDRIKREWNEKFGATK